MQRQVADSVHSSSLHHQRVAVTNDRCVRKEKTRMMYVAEISFLELVTFRTFGFFSTLHA